MLPIVDDTYHTIGAVVGCGVGFDNYLPEWKSVTGREVADVFNFAQLVSPCCPVSFSGHVYRQAELAMKDAHAASVVNMVVRDENRIDSRNVPAMQSEPLLGFAPADPGIE